MYIVWSLRKDQHFRLMRMPIHRQGHNTTLRIHTCTHRQLAMSYLGQGLQQSTPDACSNLKRTTWSCRNKFTTFTLFQCCISLNIFERSRKSDDFPVTTLTNSSLSLYSRVTFLFEILSLKPQNPILDLSFWNPKIRFWIWVSETPM